MWVLAGPFDDACLEEPQAHRSKLLKAGKTYIVGRKDQPLVLGHKKISREHAKFVVAECSIEDATNPAFIPSLTLEFFKSESKKTISRHMIRVGKDDPYVINPGEVADLQHGDVVHMVTGVTVTVQWVKVCCYRPPSPAMPSFSLQDCSELGICMTPAHRPDVTHHLTPTYSLTPDLAASLVAVACIVRPEWLTEVIRLGSSTNAAPSALEESFSLPPTHKFYPSFSPSLPISLRTFGKWGQNEARVALFRGFRFIFVVEKGREIQEAMRALVKQSEGSQVGHESSPLPDVVPNTHPDEPSIPPVLAENAPRRNLPRRAISRTSSLAPSPPPAIVEEVVTAEDPQHKPRRILVRRAGKPKTPIIGIDDPSVDDFDGELLLSQAIQDVAPSPMEPSVKFDALTQTSAPPRSRLKRRAGTSQTTPSNHYGLTIESLEPGMSEPPLKKFKSLFEESDPERIIQSDSAMEFGTYSSQPAQSLTQSETGMTQAASRSRVAEVVLLAPLAEEEEESMSGLGIEPGTSSTTQERMLKRKIQDVGEDAVMEEAPGRVKRRAVENVNAIESEIVRAVPKPSTNLASKPSSKTAAKPPSKVLQSQKSQKPSSTALSKPDVDEAFLRAVATTKRGKKAEDSFDREFNNLRISKPELNKDQQQKEWAVLDDFGDEKNLRGNFMVIVEMDVYKKEDGRQGLKLGQGRIDWEGRRDFKKFKRKSPLDRRLPVELIVEDDKDYGVGSQYWKDSTQVQSQPDINVAERPQVRKQQVKSETQIQRKGKRRASPKASDSDEDDSSLTAKTTQTRTASSQTQKRQTRQTGRKDTQALFIDSEDDGQELGADLPLSDGDAFPGASQDGEFDDGLTLRSTGRTQGTSARRDPTQASKKAPIPIVDDDSDDGTTFKGFGAKRSGRKK
ncbi:uncharacterized protein FIBRA_02061 [Fibroporia radiculosa]|uniref:Uncharacterized protein n=1 Tax=Fibroporia radiculosa TaxID=599839 RepID=J4GM95_9APHY|nr:uncharacterized protein FIBRA_02061 [Fibroporia radiculosa]CCM00035.1 predicted protein [Fibroporia radiculosa]